MTSYKHVDNDQIDAVIKLVQRRLIRSQRIENQEGILADWNSLPYGTPSICKAKLIVVLDGCHSVKSILQQALHHCLNSCGSVTKYVLFYVDIPLNDWMNNWFEYEPAFSRLEDNGIEIRIHFNGHNS